MQLAFQAAQQNQSPFGILAYRGAGIGKCAANDSRSQWIGAGAIHLSADGRFLYAVNRGDDNHIVVFAVDAGDGRLTALQRRSTEAASTREFTIAPDGRFLLLAIQGANAIAVLRRDPASGLLGDTVQTLALPKPSYLQFLRTR